MLHEEEFIYRGYLNSWLKGIFFKKELVFNVVLIKEREDRHLHGFFLRTEKNVENESGNDNNCNWCPWNHPGSSGKETGKNWDHSIHSTVKIS